MSGGGIPLILASASPRRKEILEAHGFEPIVIPAGVDESLPEDACFTPEETTMYLAGLKAMAVLEILRPEDWPRGCIILGVDTIVYKDRIIGKPVDEEDSLGILRSLKNAVHKVISGVCIIYAIPEQTYALNPRQNTPAAHTHPLTLSITEKTLFSDTTTVRFGDYTDEEILAYIRANPPYDKSGSYAIQSDWGRHVLEMDGDIENVIGLPFKKLSTYLQQKSGLEQHDCFGRY